MLTSLAPLIRKPRPVVDPAQRDLEHERLVLEEERRRLEQDREAFARRLPMSSTEIARLIIAAGRKRRAEDSAEHKLPENPQARAIVLSGQKRRAEISDVDAAWLSDYCRGQDGQ